MKKFTSLLGVLACAAEGRPIASVQFNNRFLAEDSCKLVEACSLCDSQQRKQIAECESTGRIERWECEPLEDGEDESTTVVSAGAGTRYLYRSCRRTKADDEFLMVRFQVVCVLVGTGAFIQSRKQKALSASLFDQRKLNIDAKRRRRDSSLPVEEIEMGKMDEMVPLTDDSVDVV